MFRVKAKIGAVGHIVSAVFGNSLSQMSRFVFSMQLSNSYLFTHRELEEKENSWFERSLIIEMK